MVWNLNLGVLGESLSQTGAQRLAAYRSRQREAGVFDVTRNNSANIKKRWKQRSRTKERPFCGCDGEGAGTDDKRRQNYLLFRMGERELYNNGLRLTTWDLLDFICRHPGREILIGFAFGYDSTMILRDLPVAQQKRLFQPKQYGQGHSPYVWFREFDIDYLPKQYLKVRRVKIVRDSEGREERVVIKGSTRTIFETFGFFQKSFIKVLNEFGVGTEIERQSIADNKARRSSFLEIGPEERAYCELECKLLADLMSTLRENCNAADIVPRTWNGAGKLGRALLIQHKMIEAKQINALIPKGVLDFANMAYYGGRFEITRTGLLTGAVYEYDINSAYPSNMRGLPCLEHGTWEKVGGQFLDDCLRRHDNRLFVASCSFKTGNQKRDVRTEPPLGGLPIRSKDGHLFWPLQGAGVYWSVEIESARRLGFEIRCKEGWLYHKTCECETHDWMEPLFEYRKTLGKSTAGYPLKLGYNSCYGQYAQRIGAGRFTNFIWAGLITARTRAQLNDAISLNPSKIVMLATDGVYSLEPLTGLECGDRLGQWEANVLEGLFIVQPGLYWSPNKRKRKSRGLSGKFFEDLEIDGMPATEKFEQEWKRFHEFENSKIDVAFPAVRVPVPGFVGLKLAVARNKPDLAGTWSNDSRKISFDYHNKRTAHAWLGDAIVTQPKRGYAGLVSLPHREFLAAGGQEPWEAARLMLEEQPDFIDLGIPKWE